MTIEEERKGWNRIYIIHDLWSERQYKCPQKACVFCYHCTDVFWDYTNGPYMVICSIGGDTKSGWVGHCKQFKEE